MGSCSSSPGVNCDGAEWLDSFDGSAGGLLLSSAENSDGVLALSVVECMGGSFRKLKGELDSFVGGSFRKAKGELDSFVGRSFRKANGLLDSCFVGDLGASEIDARF